MFKKGSKNITSEDERGRDNGVAWSPIERSSSTHQKTTRSGTEENRGQGVERKSEKEEPRKNQRNCTVGEYTARV